MQLLPEGNYLQPNSQAALTWHFDKHRGNRAQSDPDLQEKRRRHIRCPVMAEARFANGARDSDGQTALMHASQYRADPAAACEMIQEDRPTLLAAARSGHRVCNVWHVAKPCGGVSKMRQPVHQRPELQTVRQSHGDGQKCKPCGNEREFKRREPWWCPVLTH